MSTLSFTLVLLAGSVVVGYLLGGRLRNLLDLRIRLFPLALLGYGIQAIPAHRTGPAVALLLVSFGVLFAFGMANLRAPGLPLLCIGLVLNFAVIAANSGMPVPRAAVIASGQEATIPALEHSAVKHHLAGPHDVLLPLADLVGIGAHLVGAAGILYANKGRVATQQGVGASTIAKAALTGVALAATGYSRALGKKLEQADGEPVEGGTDPTPATSPDVARAQRQLKVCQWLIPALTGGLEVLNALHGEQQRPSEQASGILAKPAQLLSALVDPS